MIKYFSIALLLIIIGAGFIYGPNLIRLNNMLNLYNEDKISYNFINMKEIFNYTSPIKASEKPHTFETAKFDLPESFIDPEGLDRNLQDALMHYNTDGLIVLKDGVMVYENYWNDNNISSQHISWSVAKSFLSALIGIALNDGLIDSIDDPITKYLDDFYGTGYEGVSIKDLLQMSSGVKFNEDYGDPKSDINKFGEAVALGTPFRKFAKTLEREREPGTYNHYVSIDSQMLGMLIMEVTGKPLEDYLYEKIWNQIGMESEAYYLTDSVGDAMALGGLNATLRDYAKFGQLYLNKGFWEGNQVVPSEWVKASHYLDAPHVQPMAGELSANTWGYGYQWWVPGFPITDYTAAGVYNQYIYIDPVTNVVIAKTSSNHRFTSERQESKDTHIAMFREIARTANNIEEN